MRIVYDTAIIGAGIAGNALAKSLADNGWKTILLERKAFPRHKVCGEFLSPETASMLKALGVGNLIESLQPRYINQSRLIFSHGEVLEIPLPGTAFGLSRYSLDAALLGAAQNSGVHVQTATTVTSITSGGSGYRIETKKGKETTVYEARVVIAAWGANGHAGIVAKHEKSRIAVKNAYTGIKSHYRGVEIDNAVELYFFDGGYLGISPVADGIVNIAALMQQKSFLSKPKTVQGWIDAAMSRNSKLAHKLAKAVPVPGTQAAVAPVDLSRKPVAWGVYPNIGDAALMIPPLCGDGMSMALRSAQLCAVLADHYLGGRISLGEWKLEYERLIAEELGGPRQWGRLIQWMIDAPLLPRIIVPFARYTPGLMRRLVKATRLKESSNLC